MLHPVASARGYARSVDVAAILLAPVRVPIRIAGALDDLATLAERARREPDPVEEVRERIDKLLAELVGVNAVARDVDAVARALVAVGRQVVAGGSELTEETRRLQVVGREIVVGGQDLTATARVLDADTRELTAGGARLTEVTEELEEHARTFRAALPRLLAALDTVEELEDAVGTVADTVEPLQGAAERVGRVTSRFSRAPSD
jgi:hypothetical protein